MPSRAPLRSSSRGASEPLSPALRARRRWPSACAARVRRVVSLAIATAAKSMARCSACPATAPCRMRERALLRSGGRAIGRASPASRPSRIGQRASGDEYRATRAEPRRTIPNGPENGCRASGEQDAPRSTQLSRARSPRALRSSRYDARGIEVRRPDRSRTAKSSAPTGEPGSTRARGDSHESTQGSVRGARYAAPGTQGSMRNSRRRGRPHALGAALRGAGEIGWIDWTRDGGNAGRDPALTAASNTIVTSRWAARAKILAD